tara:strand:+ start:31600 stop:32058 length:459 start_codon:yes stop_codon:yes gene_type:complete
MFRPELIDARETYPLRHSVLRPTLTIDQVGMEHDDLETSFHVGARCTDTGNILAIMTVMRDPLPDGLIGTGMMAWRIRGMASHPEARGTGAGGAVLAFGIAHAWGMHNDLIWCNARRVAYGFYERYGFEIVGDEFDIEGIGPHKVMVRQTDR